METSSYKSTTASATNVKYEVNEEAAHETFSGLRGDNSFGFSLLSTHSDSPGQVWQPERKSTGARSETLFPTSASTVTYFPNQCPTTSNTIGNAPPLPMFSEIGMFVGYDRNHDMSSDQPDQVTQILNSQYADSSRGNFGSVKNTFNLPMIFPSKDDVLINSAIRLPEASDPSFWCYIYYNELDERVGDVYKSECRAGQQHFVIVDGYFASSDNTRFCLGVVTNVNRNPVAASVLKSIGKGMRIYQEGDNIFLECLSESPIFVQSPHYASKNADHPATVYRLQSDGSTASTSLCVFSQTHFDELLVLAKSGGYDRVFDLQTMCQVRVSFVKGWGCEYRRQTITATPCWVEVQFPRPLQILDKTLSRIEEPNDDIMD